MSMIQIDPTFEFAQIPGGFIIRTFDAEGMDGDTQIGKAHTRVVLSKREALMRLSRHIDEILNSDQIEFDDVEEILP